MLPVLEYPVLSDGNYIMTLLSCFSDFSKLVDYKTVAKRIIPHLWQCAMDDNLTLEQVQVLLK